MITKIKKLYTNNVFIDNEVINLPRFRNQVELEIAAVVWILSSTNVRANHKICGNAAISEIKIALNSYECWLLACHTSWQADNRINRYNKLWKSLTRRLEADGNDFIEGAYSEEYALESPDGIKYFGAIHFDDHEIENAINVIEMEPASSIVLVPDNTDTIILSLIHDGWSRADFGPSPVVLASIIKEDGIVLSPYGSFDDSESGVCLFGSPEIVSKLRSGS